MKYINKPKILKTCSCCRTEQLIHENYKICQNCRGTYSGGVIQKAIADPSYIPQPKKSMEYSDHTTQTWRFSKECRLWREQVRTKANHTCECCGYKEQDEVLQCHHIIEAQDRVDLRYDVSNGKYLCLPCHAKIHNYKYPMINKLALLFLEKYGKMPVCENLANQHIQPIPA